ncbi:hypothetical protein DFH11DRAFT_630305 [Phellopilus nigrolimitatus]|nr:hypothetical protein DFH11DRAFT_630305 [Phellopilus nigrolimitatus]
MRCSAYRDLMPGATVGPPASVIIPKAPKTPHSVRVQLASYVAEVFSARGDRKFAFAVLVEGNNITLFFYHRSAIIEADPSTSRVIRHISHFFSLCSIATFLTSVSTRSWDTAIHSISRTNLQTNCNLVCWNLSRLGHTVGHQQDRFGEKLASPYCLIGRGTSVIKANIDGYKLAIKFSWQAKTRKNEDEFILNARTLVDIIKHIPEIFGKAVVNDMTPVAKLRDACMRKGEIFEVREFRALVMREYFPIYILKPKDFWAAIVQIVRCLHTLFVRLKMLHGDISIGNIAYYINDKNEIVAVLLDFDLASYFPFKQSSNHRTGTAPFMAREVLNLDNKEFTRDFHHDLESVFYTVVWYGVGYYGYTIPKKGDVLAKWRKGSWGDIMEAKEIFITSEGTGPSSMKRVFKYIEDKEIRIHCQGIGKCFYDASAVVTAHKTLENERWYEMSFEEKLLADDATEQVAAITAPPVTYVKWMKSSGEDPSCTCCPKSGDTQ